MHNRNMRNLGELSRKICGDTESGTLTEDEGELWSTFCLLDMHTDFTLLICLTVFLNHLHANRRTDNKL